MPKGNHNPVDIHVGARVRQARLMASMSQEKLGDALGLTFQQVQKYEKGTNRIGSSRLHQIALVLDRPVAWFYEGLTEPGTAGRKAVDDPLQPLASTRSGLALARAWNAIEDDDTRRAILAIAEAAAALCHPAAQKHAA